MWNKHAISNLSEIYILVATRSTHHIERWEIRIILLWQSPWELLSEKIVFNQSMWKTNLFCWWNRTDLINEKQTGFNGWFIIDNMLSFHFFFFQLFYWTAKRNCNVLSQILSEPMIPFAEGIDYSFLLKKEVRVESHAYSTVIHYHVCLHA